MTPTAPPSTSVAGRVADHVFEELRTGITYAPVVRDRGEKTTLAYTGGAGGAIAFQPADVSLERGLFFVQFEGPEWTSSERIDPGELQVSVTVQVPRGRDRLVHYADTAARILTAIAATLAGDPPVQVWHARTRGQVAGEDETFTLLRLDHEFQFQTL